jgi:hypothetical protein
MLMRCTVSKNCKFNVYVGCSFKEAPEDPSTSSESRLHTDEISRTAPIYLETLPSAQNCQKTIAVAGTTRFSTEGDVTQPPERK